jgi:DNA relaxase NicK
VDWLTATCKSEADYHDWDDLARKTLYDERALGNLVKPWNFRSYAGVGSGRIHYGQREDSSIIVLSGALAASHLQYVYPLADNVSRIDLAVTVRVEPEYTGLERAIWQAALAVGVGPTTDRRGTLTENLQGGATMTWGSRTSERYLRVYNKGQESGQPRYQNCHRWELELKGGVAWHTARAVVAQPQPGPYVRGYLHSYMLSKRLLTTWTPDTEVDLVPGFTRRSDASTRLTWLSKSVRPSLVWLQQAGHGQHAYDALGVGPPPTDGDYRTPEDAVSAYLQHEPGGRGYV